MHFQYHTQYPLDHYDQQHQQPQDSTFQNALFHHNQILNHNPSPSGVILADATSTSNQPAHNVPITTTLQCQYNAQQQQSTTSPLMIDTQPQGVLMSHVGMSHLSARHNYQQQQQQQQEQQQQHQVEVSSPTQIYCLQDISQSHQQQQVAARTDNKSDTKPVVHLDELDYATNNDCWPGYSFDNGRQSANVDSPAQGVSNATTPPTRDYESANMQSIQYPTSSTNNIASPISICSPCSMSPTTTTTTLKSPDCANIGLQQSSSSSCASTISSPSLLQEVPKRKPRSSQKKPEAAKESTGTRKTRPRLSKPKAESEGESNDVGGNCGKLVSKTESNTGEIPNEKSTTADGEKVFIKRIRRVKANDRERTRMHNLNEALDRLRKHIPGARKDPKMTKIGTLRSAQEYILMLSKILKETSPAETNQQNIVA